MYNGTQLRLPRVEQQGVVRHLRYGEGRVDGRRHPLQHPQVQLPHGVHQGSPSVLPDLHQLLPADAVQVRARREAKPELLCGTVRVDHLLDQGVYSREAELAICPPQLRGSYKAGEAGPGHRRRTAGGKARIN
ncbi:unnamed protein product [Ectocarpus fasciculatus]